MDFKDIARFQLRRVNPFQGLVIDSDTWNDAHEYHRSQQRLHLLAFHDVGIVGGLKVVANKPADLSVSIQPGMAVDEEGNIIIVPEIQHYQIQSRENHTIYLIIQFREVPAEPYQPPEGGQPTRILEAYRIQEREKLPDEPYLELCRINLDTAEKAIRDAGKASQPGKNEIDLRFRKEVTQLPIPPVQKPPSHESVPIQAKEAVSRPVENITIGHAVLSGDSRDLHIAGLQNLVKGINRQGNYAASLVENIALDKKVKQHSIIYLTGISRFELTDEQNAALSDFLQSGGVIFGEGCAEGQQGTSSKSSKEFGLAFNKLASLLKCKLEIVTRGHPLLSACHVFAEVPQGVEPAMLLAGGQMIYSGSDYGCAWQGGHQDTPLSRDIIRASFEIGMNIVTYACIMKAGQ
ncbi:MAG: hypothetical protein A2158_07375 [Chloroflexi bacterium RBG_13_46_14]|nr:MAG: hypothetical protein A2158_07375 [Chloroflexi bacterium RBG_13_46_14]